MFKFEKNGGTICKYFTESDCLEHHVLVSHFQAEGCWNVELEDNLKFPLDFICLPSGKATELLDVIKELISAAKKPMKVTGMIWQNSIREISLDYAASLLEDLKSFLKDHPNHNVAISECLFAPKDREYFEHISRINAISRQFNLDLYNAPFPLNKVGLGKKRAGKNALTEKPDRWIENNIQPGGGYQLKDKAKLLKFIKTYHLKGFAAIAQGNRDITPQNLDEKSMFIPTPAFDLREKISKETINRVDSDESLHTDHSMSLNQTTSTDLDNKLTKTAYFRKNPDQDEKTNSGASNDLGLKVQEFKKGSCSKKIGNEQDGKQNIDMSKIEGFASLNDEERNNLKRTTDWINQGLQLGTIKTLLKTLKDNVKKKERKKRKRLEARVMKKWRKVKRRKYSPDPSTSSSSSDSSQSSSSSSESSSTDPASSNSNPSSSSS